ncbi:microtubule-associated protein futsch-like isoform X3 [Branchiostoma lanceolatum]|uniref:microtubule-associated protein futsch-like isoform X3 n=1 Tax=Branchiostoma lanceolatum TaxID=7740 RepID=UPI00345386C8
MERSRVANHAGAYKKQKDGGIDKRALRAHRRSIDQRNIRDHQLMGRRKIDDMSPLKEVDLNISQDHQEQAAVSKHAVKPDRREMLLKWRQEKELKQKLAAREKVKNRTFKVCHVKYDPTPTWSTAEGDKKKTKPVGPMRVSARLAAKTEAKPKSDAPVRRVTRSRAASANQKEEVEPPKRTTRQRVPSGTAAGKQEAPQHQTRKRATSTKETEPKPAPMKKRAASGAAAAKQAEPTRVTRARAKSEAQGLAEPAANHRTMDDGLDDDPQPVNFDFSLSKVTTVSNQRGEPQESNPGPSFAPAEFSFHAPSHLPSFSFTPMSPRSADAFLFPGSGVGGSFLNSPVVSKNNRHSTPKSVTRRSRRTSKRAEGSEAAPITMATEQPTNEMPSIENQTNKEPEAVAMATDTQTKEESAPIPMATEETANEDTASEQPVMPEPAPIAMETEKEASEGPADEPANGEPLVPEEAEPKEEAEQVEAPLEEPMPEAQDVSEVPASAETLQDDVQVHEMEVSQETVQETPHNAPAANPSSDAPEQVIPSLHDGTPAAVAAEDVMPVKDANKLIQPADDFTQGPEETPAVVDEKAAAAEDGMHVGDINGLIQPADDNMQPEDEAEAHDVPYFRRLLVSQAEHLTVLCSKWEDVVTEDGLSEEVQGQIRTTIGQAQLLMDQRFKQFSGLVDNCEFNTGEKETTCQDLQGFWDMVYFQVEDVDKKFDDLEKLKARNWEPEEVKKPVKVKKKIVKKPIKKPAVKSSKDREAARKRLAEAKAAMKAAMMANKEQKEQKEEAKVTEETVTFDGGFFKVNSPAKTPQFHCRAGTPLKVLNATSEDRRLSRTMDPQMRRRSNRLTPKPVSQLIQALTHTPGNKQSPVAMETINKTPSSAGPRRSGRLTPQPITAPILEDTPDAMATRELVVIGTPVKLHSPIGERSELTEDVDTEDFVEHGVVAITTEMPQQGEERKQSFSMFLMPTSSAVDNSDTGVPESHDSSTEVPEPMETELTNTSDAEMHSPMKRSLATMFDQEGHTKVKTPARRVARKSMVNFVSPPEEGCLAKPLPKTPAPNMFKTRLATEEPVLSPLTSAVLDKPACATPATLLASLNMNPSRQEDTMDIGFTPPDQNPIRGTEGGVGTYRSSLSSDEEEEDPTINLMGFSPDPPIRVKKQSSSEDEETAGTAVRFAAITPSKKMRDYMGTDVVMSPVRRSMRLESAGAASLPQTVVRNLHDLPEDVDYGYQPNKSVL